MRNDADCHKLLAVVATVHHQRVCKALDNRALGFAEAFYCVTAGGMGDVDGGTDLNVVAIHRKF